MTDPETYRFTLFVTGESPRAEVAVTNLRRICEEFLGAGYEVRVVDVLEDPEAAEEWKILATPTLVKEEPLPQRRVTGDLSDTEKVLQYLMLAAGGRNGRI